MIHFLKKKSWIKLVHVNKLVSIRWMKNEYVEANIINCYQKQILYISSQLFIRKYTTNSTYSRYTFFNVSALLKLDKKFIMLTSLKLIFTGVLISCRRIHQCVFHLCHFCTNFTWEYLNEKSMAFWRLSKRLIFCFRLHPYLCSWSRGGPAWWWVCVPPLSDCDTALSHRPFLPE